MKKHKDINVTFPSLPPLNEFVHLLEGIWTNGILTHNGPLVQRFEKELAKFLGIKNFVAVTSGTTAIQIAIKALELKGEIITTSFSWVATLSAIKWENCKPIFCDINPDTLNIDPKKIESLITKDTVAIMPVHVFGNPCDVVEIQKIANKYGLKVIYDAAHALGSTFKGKSVLEFGDISAVSLHATKILNTAEGGGCISADKKLNTKIKRIRFFGFDDTKSIIEDGMNGKMTEVHAALGISNLKYLESVLADRKKKFMFYASSLSNNNNYQLQAVDLDGSNFSYFPIILRTEEKLLKIQKMLEKENIFTRRYFYPSLNTLNKLVSYQNTPISEDISKRILCLPLHQNINNQEIKKVLGILNG